MKHYFIWGMGLLGTSLALDLKRLGHKVSGADFSEKNRTTLKELGFHEIYPVDTPEMWKAIKKADGIIIATPVDAIYSILQSIVRHELSPSAWVTDMASTKSDLMHWIDQWDQTVNFIGSHPMAGSDLSGPENGRENLFLKATIYITPSENMRQKNSSERYEKSIGELTSFWKETGALPHQIPYHVHDKWAAYLSHGLHLVACMVSHLAKEIPGVFEVPSSPTGGSFRDLTRVAGSNPDLWDGIINTNRPEVITYLKSLETMVRDWREKLEKDELPIKQIFSESAQIRSRLIKNGEKT